MINPIGLGVLEWTDFTGVELVGLCIPPKLLDPMKWRDWGATLLQSAEIAALGPPSPYDFPDWREWAIRFNQVFEQRLGQ